MRDCFKVPGQRGRREESRLFGRGLRHEEARLIGGELKLFSLGSKSRNKKMMSEQ